MANVAGLPLVNFIYQRCRYSRIDKVVVATSADASDDELVAYCQKNAIPVMRGNLNDVLQRFIEVATMIEASVVIRVCGDTPFVDVALIDNIVKALIAENLEYAAPSRETCASAFYAEAVTLGALRKAALLTNAIEDREHVTRFIINHADIFAIRLFNAKLNPDFMVHCRLTVDYPDDLRRVNEIVHALPDKYNFTSKDVLAAAERYLGKCAE